MPKFNTVEEMWKTVSSSDINLENSRYYNYLITHFQQYSSEEIKDLGVVVDSIIAFEQNLIIYYPNVLSPKCDSLRRCFAIHIIIDNDSF